MSNNIYNPPSFNLISLFESVGRNSSLSRAAIELGISQPAVSHAIQRLERDLGVSLLIREHRGVSFTRDGKRLFEQTSGSIRQIRKAMEELKADDSNPVVTLSVSSAFATYCLLPKIVLFKQQFPDIELRCLTTDSDRGTQQNQSDLCIPLGYEKWPKFLRWPLVDEEVMAVSSPEYLKSISAPKFPQDLLQHNLLNLEVETPQRLQWLDWLKYFSVECNVIPKKTTFNDYSVIVQAALEGQGIALGWKHIIDPLLADGRLIKLLPHTWVTDNPFYILAPADQVISPAAERLRKWLLSSIGSMSTKMP